jgi:hypothetical protein
MSGRPLIMLLNLKICIILYNITISNKPKNIPVYQKVPESFGIPIKITLKNHPSKNTHKKSTSSPENSSPCIAEQKENSLEKNSH